MKNLKVKDLCDGNVDDLVNLCVPCSKKTDPYFVEGMKMKRLWAKDGMKKYGTVAKIAYEGFQPVGMIQFLPRPAEKIVDVICLFVPYKTKLRMGIGTTLLDSLIEDMRQPKPYFGVDTPNALFVKAFQIPEWYPQQEFYQKRGFERVDGDDPFTLYYPLKPGYIHSPRDERFVPQPEDRGKAVIFYDPACPFCIFFSERTKQAIRKISQDVPIKIVNKSDETEEVRKRGLVPFCVVNGVPIETTFMDEETFGSEVKDALEEFSSRGL